MSEPHSHGTRVTIALAIVYLVWGSSYLATKIMVTDEPPLVAAGLRFGLAGLLLLTFAWWRSGPPVLTRTELRHVLVMGVLAVLLANACHVIAMQYVQSNTAALLNATPALWIAWLGTFGHRRSHLTGTAKVGLLIGFLGVLLVLSKKGGFDLAGLGWQLLILLGCLSWSLGTIYYRNAGSANPPVMFTGLQMLAGSVGMLAGAWIAGEPFDVHWTGRGLAAFAWLVVMSGCVGYTSYVWLATHAAPVVVGSYGYVNPAVAALVGWLVLGETLAWTQIAGMLVILLGVALATGYLTSMPRSPVPNPEA